MRQVYAGAVMVAMGLMQGVGVSTIYAESQGELFPGARGTSDSPATAPKLPVPPVTPPPKPTTAPVVVPPPVPVPVPATAPAPPAPVKKVPPPVAAALADANSAVMEVYKDEIVAAKTPQQRTALAQKLLNAGTKETDSSGRYALLMKARDVALDAPDPETMVQTIDELDKTFEFDSLKLEADGVNLLVKTVRTPEQHGALAVAAKACVDRALSLDKFDIAKSMADAAVSAARATTDAALQKDAAAMVVSVREFETAYTDGKNAILTLGNKPKDPEANLRLGKYRCFFKSDWKSGLANLALGSDPALAELAKKDLAAPAAPDEQLKIGDAWWDIAQNVATIPKNNILRHAVGYYETAAPQLSGLAKARVDKRLKDSAAIADQIPGVPPGLLGKILVAIPKEFFPVKDDNTADLQTKTNNLRRWISDSGLVDHSGTEVTLNAKFVRTTTFITTGIPKPGEARGAPEMRLNVFFEQRLEFKGMPVLFRFTASKSVTGDDDPEAKKYKALVPGDSFTVTVKVTNVMPNIGRYAPIPGQPPDPNSPPELHLTISVTNGDFSLKPH